MEFSAAAQAQLQPRRNNPANLANPANPANPANLANPANTANLANTIYNNGSISPSTILCMSGMLNSPFGPSEVMIKFLG